MCSGNVSISDSRRVTPVKNSMKSHERERRNHIEYDKQNTVVILSTTNRIPWSYVKDLFRN